MTDCQICKKKFNKKVHNQVLCGNKECKRVSINLLGDKYRKNKPKIIVNCTICNNEFEKFGRNKTCSLTCSKKNSNNIKLKYYINTVMPRLEYKPKLTKEQVRQNYINNYTRMNNKPERKQFMKEYRLQPHQREREKASCKAYKRRNPEVGKNGHLKRNYKITLEEYNQMLLDQNLVCAICKREETSVDKKLGKVRDLAVDHCHTTGKVRGLLCWKCNTSLGKFQDSVELLQNAIKYLNKSKELSLTNVNSSDNILIP